MATLEHDTTPDGQGELRDRLSRLPLDDPQRPALQRRLDIGVATRAAQEAAWAVSVAKADEDHARALHGADPTTLARARRELARRLAAHRGAVEPPHDPRGLAAWRDATEEGRTYAVLAPHVGDDAELTCTAAQVQAAVQRWHTAPQDHPQRRAALGAHYRHLPASARRSLGLNEIALAAHSDGRPLRITEQQAREFATRSQRRWTDVHGRLTGARAGDVWRVAVAETEVEVQAGDTLTASPPGQGLVVALRERDTNLRVVTLTVARRLFDDTFVNGSYLAHDDQQGDQLAAVS